VKQIIAKYLLVCPKTKKFKGVKSIRGISRLWLPVISLASLLWVLIRVVPKPVRATYPCMRIAMPIASGFIYYLLGLLISALTFVKAKKLFYRSRYILASIFVLLGLSGSFLIIHNLEKPVHAHYAIADHQPNNPIGQAKGIFPGRVIWAYNPNATNENCDPDAHGHGWFLSENNNQQVIDRMLSDALRAVSGRTSDRAAWEAIFIYHNNTRGKETVGYAPGEKIFIKINATSSWSGNFNPSDLSIVYNQRYGISETSPQLVLAVLRQLVNIVGVAQKDIYIGDPMKHIYKHCYDLWQPEFPDVHYLDHDGYAGREKVVKSNSVKIYYSDRGAILRTGSWDNANVGDPVTEDHLYTIFGEAEYILNIPTLKGHHHAGVTMFAKNHFGSQTRNDAKHLHGGLVAPEQDNPRRQGYGLYRVQVDLMGHELLGGKNLMYLMDGLWPSDYETDEPDKWAIAPFNNDWMSSIFLSLDPVAIESVGFDFLRSEFTSERGMATYPQMDGVDDYLHQAADATTWPAGIVYDPENDGIPLQSLGVHEHWNNPVDKQYSRNIGTGNGIELIKLSPATDISDPKNSKQLTAQFVLNQNYPNPFNPETEICYFLQDVVDVDLSIFDVTGKHVITLVRDRQLAGNRTVRWNGRDENNVDVSSGIYFYRLTTNSFSGAKKMLLVR